ncbi:hypothetical protein SDC9_147536 [bioreactor metagenome]|uniref:Uncharacterized protein n=1 Tax=bioreactor metagenome TaxID=1076179 RepID=A0A645EGE2_9ZZZZ
MCGVTIDVVHDPVLQPALHVVALLEGADLVAHDALQVVGEAAGGKQIGKPRAEVGIGGGVGVVVLGRFVQRLGADEGGKVGVFLVHQGHEAILGQFCFASVRDGDLGGAFHVYSAIVGGKAVHRQILHCTARFDTAYAGTPAVFLERAIDVHCHRIGCIGPSILAVVSSAGVFLEIELLDRAGSCAIRDAAEKARHCQSDVLGVV